MAPGTIDPQPADPEALPRTYEIGAVQAETLRHPAAAAATRSESRLAGREPAPLVEKPATEPQLLVPVPQLAPQISLVVPRPPTRRAAAGLPQSTAGQLEEITEVHVNIGRIEVTAAAEQRSKPRRPPGERPAMSLDEYLARRQGDSR